ncbi:MAG: SdrD B-like domain-containing protein [Caldilinea sp.]|jgi:hypothetical protein
MKRHRLIVFAIFIQLVLVGVIALPAVAADNGTISGEVYNDVNSNGKPEVGEPNIPNATVYLQRQGEDPLVVITDGEGFFVVTGLPYGVYRVWAADASHNLSVVHIIPLGEVNGDSSVNLPIVYDLSDDVQFFGVSSIFLPLVNR